MASESDILFVNKSAKSRSLSRSNGAERARIFSHVQQNPQRQLIDGKAASTTRPYTPDTAFVWQLVESTTKSKTGTQRKDRPNVRRQDQISPSPSPSPSRDHSPSSALGLASYDPFGSTAAPITPYMNRVLEFYSGALLDRVFPNKFLADASRQHTLAYAAEDAVALNAILYSTSSTLYCHERHERERLFAMHFKGQAIHHLKQELSKSDDSSWKMSTLYAVALLLWAECLQGDKEAVEAHTKGLDFLLTRVKGITQSPLPIMTTILSCHYYCCAMLQTRPTIRPIALYDGSISQRTIESLNTALSKDRSHVCSYFLQPENLSISGDSLPQIIKNQQRYLHFKELCEAGELHPLYEDLQCIYTLQIATDFALVDLPYTKPNDLTPIEDAVRLALFVIAKPIVRIATTSSAFLRSMAQQLKGALDRCDMPALRTSNGELLLWLLFVAAYVSYGQEEWSALIAQLAATVKALGIETESEMEDVLSGFVYLKKFSGEALASAWRDVEGILKQREKWIGELVESM